MSNNRLKRLKQKLAQVRKMADEVSQELNSTADLDLAIDLKVELNALEIKEQNLEIQIETESDIEQTKE